MVKESKEKVANMLRIARKAKAVAIGKSLLKGASKRVKPCSFLQVRRKIIS